MHLNFTIKASFFDEIKSIIEGEVTFKNISDIEVKVTQT